MTTVPVISLILAQPTLRMKGSIWLTLVGPPIICSKTKQTLIWAPCPEAPSTYIYIYIYIYIMASYFIFISIKVTTRTAGMCE